MECCMIIWYLEYRQFSQKLAVLYNIDNDEIQLIDTCARKQLLNLHLAIKIDLVEVVY